MKNSLKKIGESEYSQLFLAARESPRGRMNLNIHDSYEDPCQKLIIGMHTASYVVPHRHLSPPKDECFVALQGRLGVILFGADGDVVEYFSLGPQCEKQICDIPAGFWHTVVALEENCLFLEFKMGPYTPFSESDVAKWAPKADTPEVNDFIKRMRNLFS